MADLEPVLIVGEPAPFVLAPKLLFDQRPPVEPVLAPGETEAQRQKIAAALREATIVAPVNPRRQVIHLGLTRAEAEAERLELVARLRHFATAQPPPRFKAGWPGERMVIEQAAIWWESATEQTFAPWWDKGKPPMAGNLDAEFIEALTSFVMPRFEKQRLALRRMVESVNSDRKHGKHQGVFRLSGAGHRARPKGERPPGKAGES
jgi:hypothetical protein